MSALIKIFISAFLIWVVNEVVVRHAKPLLGSMIASLPLMSLLAFFWIYLDLKAQPQIAIERLSSHSYGVFWFVLPSLPLFLIFPYLLNKGISFWLSMGIGCAVSMACYALTAYWLAK